MHENERIWAEWGDIPGDLIGSTTTNDHSLFTTRNIVPAERFHLLNEELRTGRQVGTACLLHCSKFKVFELRTVWWNQLCVWTDRWQSAVTVMSLVIRTEHCGVWNKATEPCWVNTEDYVWCVETSPSPAKSKPREACWTWAANRRGDTTGCIKQK